MNDLLTEANFGRELWLGIKKADEIRLTDVIIFFPEDSVSFNKTGIKLLTRYMESKRFTRAIIITDDKQLYDYVDNILRDNKYVKRLITRKYLDALLRYYRLVQFFPNIVVMSRKKPFGSDGMINSGRIFEEEYNRLLNDFIRVDEPEYAKYLQ